MSADSSVFRMLVQAGTDGDGAGEIARRLGVPANALPAIDSRRESRLIIYTAAYERTAALLEGRHVRGLSNLTGQARPSAL